MKIEYNISFTVNNVTYQLGDMVKLKNYYEGQIIAIDPTYNSVKLKTEFGTPWIGINQIVELIEIQKDTILSNHLFREIYEAGIREGRNNGSHHGIF